MRIALLGTCLLILAGSHAHARDIYVNSRIGSNAYDGTASEPLNAWVGPVRSIERAMELVGAGDSVILVDNGTPYFGSITFLGSRFSGTSGQPFRLVGNGATISGAKPVDPRSWVEISRTLWRITPIRKGWYQLVENGAALPRVELARPADLETIPAGSWGVLNGAVYYRSLPEDIPALHEFWLAEMQTGLTLLDVQHVVISDVTFQHFRIDGISAHDRCRDVLLQNVTCIENGRAGVCVAGSSRIEIQDSRIGGNAHHSLLISELGQASVDRTDFDVPPEVSP